MKYKVFIFLLFFGAGLSAQVESTPKVEVKNRSEKNMVSADSLLSLGIQTDNELYPKKITPDFQSKYKGKEFDYSENQPEISFWEKIKRRLGKILEYLFGDLEGMNTIRPWKIVFRILAVIVVGVILYFIIKFLVERKGNLFFAKKNTKLEIPVEDVVENIHEVDFPETIAKYERQRDYRSAVRYHFLWILKQLTDKKIIEWNPEKTNKDYIAEIQKADIKQGFKEIALIFDYIWYGEFKIDEPKYRELEYKYKELR